MAVLTLVLPVFTISTPGGTYSRSQLLFLAVISASLYERFESRDNGAFTAKVLSAMRSEFGGHAEKKK